MWRRMDTGSILLAKRSSVLRYLAESELSVSPCAVASVHLHCELHRSGALCVFRRAGWEAAAIAGTQVLAQRWLWTRYTVCNYSKLRKYGLQYEYIALVRTPRSFNIVMYYLRYYLNYDSICNICVINVHMCGVVFPVIYKNINLSYFIVFFMSYFVLKNWL